MVLTSLQSEILRTIAANRSETSYIAGGVVLNSDWPRQSDDLDIFHDTDEEIGEAANADIVTLRAAGFHVAIDIEIYGCVEATVSKNGQSTILQWMSEARTRFFPLIRDNHWGSRLHPVDLAVNKIIAASTRSKARDFVDLVTIEERMSPLGPLVLAAAGKPPHFSPRKIVDEIRRRGLSISTEDYETVKGLPPEWTAAFIRTALADALDAAEDYLLRAPVETIGLIAVDEAGNPVELDTLGKRGITLRKATAEPEAIPAVRDLAEDWKRSPRKRS
ncbi:MAG: hypothetical protein ACTHJ3_13640 [Pararhizobium sp.]